MKALVVGTGGVGQSIAAIAKRRDPKGEWLEKMVMADYDGKRAADFVATLADPRFVAEQVDASDVDAVAALVEKHGADILMNLCAPNFNPPLLQRRPQGQGALPRHRHDAERVAPHRPVQQDGQEAR